jgi:hypothetical protein
MTVGGIVSGHLFSFLRYYVYLRTLRWLIDQFGLEALPFATTFAPSGPDRPAKILDLLNPRPKMDQGEPER